MYVCVGVGVGVGVGGGGSGLKSGFKVMGSVMYAGVWGCRVWWVIFGPALFESTYIRQTNFACQVTHSIPPQGSRNESLQAGQSFA